MKSRHWLHCFIVLASQASHLINPFNPYSQDKLTFTMSVLMSPSLDTISSSCMAACSCEPMVTISTTETVYATIWTTNLLTANHNSTWEATYTITEIITGDPADYRRPAFPPCFVETTVECNECAGGEATLTITVPTTEPTPGVTIQGDDVAAQPQPVPVDDAPVPTSIEAPPSAETTPEEVHETTVTLLPLPDAPETPEFVDLSSVPPPATPTDVPDEVLEPETGNEVPSGAASAPEDEESGEPDGVPPTEASVEAFVEAAAPSTRQGPGSLWLTVVITIVSGKGFIWGRWYIAFSLEHIGAY
ncbi:hypothetical protein ACRALDRAFT_2015767 [Sodiomyces alcalophilus JCM 7366]|uniref:uncharacterized protein n=1 Tax=Sodiomyces alcalophilus JCM 7366 TaxID=591952 RepID=UPI0039B48C1D